MNTLLGTGARLPRIISSIAWTSAAAFRPSAAVLASSLSQRWTHHDGTRCMIGDREIVGYGANGNPVYFDCPDFPFPAIRYREVTPEICALREKEQKDWKKLTVKEKKDLYRHSFCQTYAEFQHFTPEWKLAVASACYAIAISLFMTMFYYAFVYKGMLPDTFEEERRQAQLRRIIQLQMNPITGIASDWDYCKNKWK